MKAVVLAGGAGTRLAPYTTVFPKPLVPLGNQPILEIILRQLVHYGFTDIALSVGYLAELIQAYIGSLEDGDLRRANIKFVRESKPMGTVGSLALIEDLHEPFLVMNGDVLTALNFAELFEYHKKQQAMLTIAMHRRSVKIDLGLIEVNAENRLEKFVEKPTMNFLVSMGVYVYDPAVLKLIEPGQYLDFPDLVLRLLADKEKVMGFSTDEYWLDLGSHADYAKASEEFEDKKAQILPWMRRET